MMINWQEDGLTVNSPRDTVPTNLRVETPREAMVMGRYALVSRASDCEMVRRKDTGRLLRSQPRRLDGGVPRRGVKSPPVTT